MMYLTLAITIFLAICGIVAIRKAINEYQKYEYKDCIDSVIMSIFFAICTWLGFMASLYYKSN
jgi:uncharacterized BrkB/YihY/UPF0761 family membrane protein